MMTRVAVTGMSCRFPGAPGLREYWALLRDGRSAISEVPRSRSALRAAFDREVTAPGKTNLERGGFLSRVDGFDTAFFGVPPREAARLDPQQKLLLELTQEALEDAGESPADLAGRKVGVFVGVMSSDHALGAMTDVADVDIYLGTSTGHGMTASRLSYVFDFTGPSLAIDTACSSSLVAMHLACDSLRSGQCEVAIVAGVNLVSSPALSIFYTKAGIASPDGVCRAFDASANGIIRGEGAGVVVLTSERRAAERRSAIYAFVRGTAVNQDGRSNGMTAPNGAAQQQLVRDALARADVSAAEIAFVEAHGTGTQLGDTIEAIALGEVLGKGRVAGAPRCAIGSVKTNLGHLEAAAGVASFIKAALALDAGALPASLHCAQPNPRIPFDALGLCVQSRLETTPSRVRPVFAGVSSFGLGGTNAHVVLESAPRAESPADDPAGALPFLLSGKTEEHLRRAATEMRASIDACEGPLAGVAAMLMHGRQHHPHRIAILAASRAELSSALEAFLAGRDDARVWRADSPPRKRVRAAAHLGGGPAYALAAQHLFVRERAFAEAVQGCASALGGDEGKRLASVIASGGSALMEPPRLRAALAFTTAYAVAAALAAWGVELDKLHGEGIGHYVAQAIRRELSLDDALERALALCVADGWAACFAIDLGRSGAIHVAPPLAPRDVDAVEEHITRALVRIHVAGAAVRWSSVGALKGVDKVRVETSPFRRRAEIDRSAIFDVSYEPRLAARDEAKPARTTVILTEEGDALGAEIVALVRADGGDCTTARWTDLPSFGEIDRVVLLAARAAGDLPASLDLASRVVPAILERAAAAGRDIDLVVVTRGAHDGVHPAQACISAVARAGAREVTRACVGVVDLDEKSAHDAQVIAQELCWRGCASDDGTRATVAYRRGVRLEPTLRAAPDLAEPIGPERLRDRGVYLVTGALGGIGREVAAWLARRFRARLVLVGRHANAASEPARSLVARLESAGAEVIVVAGDVADESFVRGVVQSAVARWGALHGVFHAAGVLHDEPLIGISPESMANVLRPKVQGTLSLDRATSDLPLDFFVLFSSFASLVAPAGQASHAAANAFEDAYARGLARRGRHALSVGWGFWGETGVVASEAMRLRMDRLGIESIATDEGIAALETLLRGERCHVAYVKAASRASLEAMRFMPIEDAIAPEASAPSIYEREASALRAIHGLDALGVIADGLDALAKDYARAAFTATGESQLDPSQASLAAALRAAVAESDKAAVRDFAPSRPPSALSPGDLVARADALLRAFPRAAAEIALVRRCGESLADVLTGARDPLEVLFPKGSSALVEAFYASAPLARCYNGMAERMAAGWLSERCGLGAPLRVLEIGAGTGATTEPLLRVLPASRVRYTFTDVTPMLVERARRKLAPHTHVDFAVLDIEADPAAGALRGQRFDLIVSANCLHATRSIRQTLANTHALLAPGGSLLLVEAVKKSVWLDLVFGMASGWWRFADRDLRADCALLSADAWSQCLRESGFGRVARAEFAFPPAKDADVAVILASLPVATEKPISKPEPRTMIDRPSKAVTGPAGLVLESIVDLVASTLRVATSSIPLDDTFESMGLDSLHAVEIGAQLSARLGQRIAPTAFFEHRSIRKLAEHLAGSAAAPLPQAAAVMTLAEAPVVPRRDPPAKSPAPPDPPVTPQSPAVLEPLAPAAPLAAPADGAIAIIGYACRFPGAPDAARFWELLSEGRDVVGEIPAERWPAGRADTSRWGGFLDHVDEFDPLFFKISPREARTIDPQQRLFLEVTWEALEQSGYARRGGPARDVGVFAGCSHTGFSEIVAASAYRDDVPGTAFGNPNAFIPNRVSFFNDFRGPSMLVDTMCSSSLVAVHQACEALRRGECAMALAGGVNLLFSSAYYEGMARMKAHSPDGRCKPFDHRANGFVSAEGAAAILLKPLARALADGDTVHAVIRGSAVAHDGATNGLTAPSAEAQADVIRRALARASVSAASISYVEAHGTGTSLGDPIEVQGLTRAFAGVARQSCLLGSVKSNIGHSEAASGMASILKVLLAMKHKMLPATLHFDRANDLIDFDETPFAVCHEMRAWHADGPRRAGVSSFGLGGANAHVVLEEAPAARPVEASGGPALLVLSAATGTALPALVAAFAAWLKRSPDLRLVDVCQTALVGRAHFRHRAAIVASTMLDLVRKLESFGTTSSPSSAVDAFCGEIDDDLDASVSVPCVLYRGRDAASASAALRQHAMRYVTGLATSEDAAPPPFTRVPLPTYPFERVRCWPDGASGAGALRSTSNAVPRSVPESTSTHDAAPPSRSHVAELRRSSHPLLGVRRAER